MLVISLPPEAGAGESDARLAAGRRNTAACSLPKADADLRTLLEAFRLLCPASEDLASPEADADLASPAADVDLAPRLGLARSCFRGIAPTYTHTHTSLTLLTMLCLSLLDSLSCWHLSIRGGVLYGGLPIFRGLSSMGSSLLPEAGAHFAMPQYAPIGTTYPACGYARSKMRKPGACSTGFRTTSMG